MKLYRDQIPGFIVAAILLSGLFIWFSLSRKQLLKDRKISVARIEGSSALSSSEINFQEVKSFLLNRTFPVIYSPNYPKNNYILIRPEDFNRFNYSFPDSLNWVLKYIRGKKLVSRYFGLAIPHKSQIG